MPSVSQSAASAAKNAGMGMAEVAKGLSALFKPKPGTLGMGPVFNEDTYGAAKPYFQADLANFKQAGADLARMMTALVKSLRDQFGSDAAEAMKPYAVRFMRDA